MTLSGPLSTTSRLRFRSLADNNNDRIYLDDISIMTCVSIPICDIIPDGLTIVSVSTDQAIVDWPLLPDAINYGLRYR